MTVADYVTSYCLANGVEPATQQYLYHAVRALDHWRGKTTELGELADDLLNQWISVRLAAGKSKSTVKTQRGAIITLWKSAHEDGFVERLPGKVRRVRVPRVNPDAWWPDEVARLLKAAAAAPGKFRRGSQRSDLLKAWLLVDYYTLLRPGDMLRLRHADISADGVVTMTPSKTGDPIVRYLHPDALEAVAAIRGASPLVFPVSAKTMQRWWKWLKDSAAVPGSPKWLRRTGATHCEIHMPGSAMQALGHRTPGLAYRSYVDQRQLKGRPPTPPRLG